MFEVANSNLPTLYEYYTSGGIKNGLTADNRQFKLNNMDIHIYSGAMHYFRVPRAYWRDRLRKLRASGLNTVETYVPWNLHEFQNNSFDFGKGGSDMEDFLGIQEYLKIAQEEDLLALIRPGPYICSEWEFGGLPSWLLREDDIKVRTKDSKFMKYVERYFSVLLPLLAALQFTNGGPIIGFQIENEYGSTEENGKVDDVYLQQLKEIMEKNGVKELMYTSDGISSHGTLGSVPGVLRTANFASNPKREFEALLKTQPDKALMCMEYWAGWFDHWSEKHHYRPADDYENVLKDIITYPASVNLYMFHGGTNWGFLNGANIADGSTDNKGYQPDTTSYDYDAPLSENGDYTDKYIRTQVLLKEYNPIKTKLPMAPIETKRFKYESIPIEQQLFLWDLETQIETKTASSKLISMEHLPINNNSGQSYGYIVYKKKNLNLAAKSILKISGRVCDTVMVLVNGNLISKPLTNNSDLDGFGYWRMKDSTIQLTDVELENATLELVVENWGRNNFGSLKQFVQFKGLWQGPVSIDNNAIADWDIYPLEFKKKWTTSLRDWYPVEHEKGPSLYKATLKADELYDTYIDMSGWTKGIVIVNGFVLGRYAKIGPQMSLYLPAPFLKKGDNDILVFEHFTPDKKIVFAKDPIFTSGRVRAPLF